VVQHRQVLSARGYLSQSELPLTFGLGQAGQIERVIIQWPGSNGGRQELTNLDVNREYVVRQGEKEVKPPKSLKRE